MGKAIATSQPTGTVSGDEASIFGAGGAPATEAQAQFYITEAATISYFQGYIQSGGSGTNTVTARKNGANVNITANRSGTGALSDTTNSDTFAAADLVNYAFTDTGTDPLYTFLSVVVSFSSGHGNFFSASPAGGTTTHSTASATRYLSIAGETTFTTTEADTQVKCRGHTTLAAIQLYVSANTRTTTTTVRGRLNGGNITAASFTVAGAATGNVRDTTIGSAIASGDLLNLSVTTGTGTGNFTVTMAGATLTTSSGLKSDIYNHAQNGTTYPFYGNVSGTPAEIVPYAQGGMYIGLGYYDETTAGIPAPFGMILSNPRCYVTQNNFTVATTYALRKNSTDAITVTIASAATGWFEDTTQAADYAVGDTFYAKLTSTEADDTLTVTFIDFSVTVNERRPISSASIIS